MLPRQLLCLALLVAAAEAKKGAKKKKTSKEWAAAAAAIDNEERAEWEAERAAAEAERAKNQPQFNMDDPSKWIEGMGGVENAMVPPLQPSSFTPRCCLLTLRLTLPGRLCRGVGAAAAGMP